ncbi:MAG TPA: phage tail protein [Chthoniobacter sp.]|nr:phage tail protein [Chthoniobacter sp.]
MPTGERKDPYKNHRFLVEIDGIVQAGFREVTISDSTQDAIEYREGNEPATVRKIPGLIKHANVTLKWGITDSADLFKWREQVESGATKKARRNMAIEVLDDEGKTAARWEISGAWPTKYTAPTLNATANEIAIETIEIAHEGIRRTK